MFKNPFSFNGRIRRFEYGMSLIAYTIAAVFINNAIRDDPHADFIGLIYVPLLWFLWAQGAKRCHDRNNSGWYQLIPFYVLWMIFTEGDYASNDYGNNPKEEYNQPVIINPVITKTPVAENKVYNAPTVKANDQVVNTHIKTTVNHVPIDSLQSAPHKSTSDLKQQTQLEVTNIYHAAVQDVLKKLRLLATIDSLSYTTSGNTAIILINHKNTSQMLLDDLYKILPGIEVREVKPGHISIKIK